MGDIEKQMATDELKYRKLTNDICSAADGSAITQNPTKMKGFMESFKPVPVSELNFTEKQAIVPDEKLQANGETCVKKNAGDIEINNAREKERTSLKNKWLESLEKRNKGKFGVSDTVNYASRKITATAEGSIILNKPLDKANNINSKEFEDLDISSKVETLKDFKDIKNDNIQNNSKPNEQKSDFKRSKQVIEDAASSNSNLPSASDTHEGRLSLRRGKMIPCPLCGAEYAIASNLQKHIDKDHSEGEEKSNKRKSRDKSEPVKKKKKLVNDEEEDLDNREQGLPSKETETKKSDNILESSRTSMMEVDLDNPVLPGDKDENSKLTEYEIFQKLQLKEPSKSGKKKVECKECGLFLPTNTIKRHLQKHEKNTLKAQNVEDTSITEKEEKEKKVPCTDCDKSFPANSIKKHMAKHKREKKVHNEESKDSNDLDRSGHEDFADERIPCTQCGKMLPKNAMKRHLMKHETISHESDTEKISTEKSEDDISQDTGEDEKQKVSRKKVTCVECGLQCASNVIKRHLEKHAKIKALDKSVTPNEIYAPIEITPTKEYWEYEKEKNGPKSTDGNENNEDKETGQNTQNSTNPSEYRERGDLQQRKSKDEKRERSRSRKGSVDKDPVHKAVKEL